MKIEINVFMTLPLSLSGSTLFITLLSSSLFAQEPLLLTDTCDRYPLGLHLEILEDKNKQWTIEDVTSTELSRQFVPSQQEAPSMGFTSSAYWMRFRLGDDTAKEREWLLEIDRPLIDRIELYIPKISGSYVLKKEGRLFPFEEREVKHRNFVFRLPVASEKVQTFYLRVESESAIFFSLIIWSSEAFARKDHHEQIGLGLYYGIILAMVLYNAFLFLSLRDRSYLYYVLYISTFVFTVMGKDGIAFEYVWRTIPWWKKPSQPFFMGFSLLWAWTFARSFLLTKVNLPRLDKFLLILMALSGLQLLSPLFIGFPATLKLRYGMILLSILTIIPISILCMHRGYRPARYFLISWAGFLGGIFLYLLMAFGVLPRSFLTFYGLQIGSIAEVILLSLGLADRINLIQEKEQTQRQVIGELERELQIGHDMQMGLMPKESPQIPGFDIAGRCLPATHVGGDLFQYFPQANGRFGIGVADVTGHAMEAAIPLVMFSGILRSQIELGGTLEELFGRLNHSALQALTGRTFVCFVMGDLELSTRTLLLSNGGCPYPYHYQAARNEVVELQVEAYPLGVRPDTHYPVREVPLAPGDRIVFCSDGIIEADNAREELFGFERTARTIQSGCEEDLSAEQLLDHLIHEVKSFTQDAAQGDDQTIVVLGVES